MIVQSRAKKGLFHGKHIQFGNNVSHSERKTRRTFKPNIQKVSLFSDVLDRKLRLNVTTKALRCIDKAGGLDNYLLGTSPKKLGVGRVLELRQVIQLAYAGIPLNEDGSVNMDFDSEDLDLLEEEGEVDAEETAEAEAEEAQPKTSTY